jgi:hypothetical protein
VIIVEIETIEGGRFSLVWCGYWMAGHRRFMLAENAYSGMAMAWDGSWSG